MSDLLPPGPELRDLLLVVLAAALVVAVLSSVSALVRARRETVRARAQAEQARQARNRALVARAIADQRADLARDAHDVLGHRLTLVAVGAGALEVATTDHAQRASAAAVRLRAAEAVEALDDLLVALADRDDAAVSALETDATAVVRRVTDRVSASGVRVRADLDDTVGPVDAVVARTLERVLEELCTNAVRHAPGRPVDVRLRSRAGGFVLTVENPLDPAALSARPGGRGLAGATERVSEVGGSLEAVPVGAVHAVVVRMPLGLATTSTAEPDPVLSRTTAGVGRVTRRLALQVAVLGVGASLLTVSVVGGTAVVSRLDRDAFEQITVGQDRAAADEVLPVVTMLDPPRSTPGCLYHESTVSLFDRDDVFEVCFEGDRVASTAVVEAP